MINKSTDKRYLTEDEQKQLILDVRSGKKSMDELIDFLNPITNTIIKKWYSARKNTSLDYDDLYQEAMIVTIRAVEIFDCNKKDIKFSSYYAAALNSNFMRYIKRNSTILSGISHIDPEFINSNLKVVSDTYQMDGEEFYKIDWYLNKTNQLNNDPTFENIEFKDFYETIENIFKRDKKLKNPKYKKIFNMVFYDRLTYEQISIKLNISKQRVGQIMKKIYKSFERYKKDLEPFRNLDFKESTHEFKNIIMD